MNLDLTQWTDRAWPWVRENWEVVVAAAVILILGLAIRSWLKAAPPKPRPATAGQIVDDRPNTQALDIATAAIAEIHADIEAYARALFAEELPSLARQAMSDSPQPLRFAAIAEAPFIYDGVIMRDVTLMPNALIAPVGNHFRQAQIILDAIRRQASLTPPDASGEERAAALKATAAALAAGLDKATAAAEKLDAWLVRNGGAAEPPMGLRDLPHPALRNASLDRVGQRAKTYRILREQAQARLNEIDGFIAAARRPATPVMTTPIISTPAMTATVIAPAAPAVSAPSSLAPSFDPTIISVKPSDKTAAE